MLSLAFDKKEEVVDTIIIECGITDNRRVANNLIWEVKDVIENFENQE